MRNKSKGVAELRLITEEGKSVVLHNAVLQNMGEAQITHARPGSSPQPEFRVRVYLFCTAIITDPDEGVTGEE